MLLPSALPGEGLPPTSRRPMRPSLPSFASFAHVARPETYRTDAPLQSSCRALHQILGAPLRATTVSTKNTRPMLRTPFGDNIRVKKPQPTRQSSPRGANKRGRDDFESDLENTHYGRSNNELPPDTDAMSTPKRRRRIPFDMPLGLSAADFQSLESSIELHEDPEGDVNMPELSHDCLSDSDEDCDSGYGASTGPSPTLSAVDDPSWSLDDDRILVETVLEKLQLSKRAWGDCARRLGKDKNSIGRRWKLLVDERSVGLKTRDKRPSIDSIVW